MVWSLMERIFWTLVEAQGADDLVLDPRLDEGLLEGARLGVGAEEDGRILGSEVAADHAYDGQGLVLLAVAVDQSGKRSCRIVREDRLLVPGAVVADQLACQGYDVPA